MEKIDWNAEVEKRKDNLIADLQGLLKIKSVLDEQNGTEEAPLGVEVKRSFRIFAYTGRKRWFYF